ncbi:MAG: Gfo/Idh/MocA family oxidoreductase [Eubacterium sp.]|nr:Gfo/Idh/MocA family oxidoreductase [Eubacterium sp.]
MIKVLIIGLGSAGQRHVRNLRRLFGDNVSFIAYRVKKSQRLFDDNLNVIEGRTVEEAYNIMEYDDLDLALREKPDMAFITNPNSMHISCALKVAEYGVDIFMEKPVSDSMNGIDKLNQIIREKNLILYVGFQMRMHPCILRLKQDIENGIIGKPVSVDCHMGELLTGMHQYEDYRFMNESQKATGGGVVLCQIHEIDYLYWVFGMPTEIYAIGDKYSDFEIDVEDSASSLWKYEADNGFSIILHQDFLQKPPIRRCQVIGTEGQIELDLLHNEYTTWRKNGMQEEKYPNFSRNDMFIQELTVFLDYVKSRKSLSLNLEDGIGSLKIALAIKKSISEGLPVRL